MRRRCDSTLCCDLARDATPLMLLQILVTGAAGACDEVTGQDIRRWAYAIEGKSILTYLLWNSTDSLQWWLSFTKRKFMGKSL